VAENGGQARPAGRIPQHRLAHGADPDAIAKRLRADGGKEIKAVCVVHNETSTGVTSRIGDVRKAIDAAGHPALFMVDTISSLARSTTGTTNGAWMSPSAARRRADAAAGLSFNCISPRRSPPQSREAAAQLLGLGRDDRQQQDGYFPYTPATNLLYGLREALKMLLEEEGLDDVFARHQRHAEATRRAVRAWGWKSWRRSRASIRLRSPRCCCPPGTTPTACARSILEPSTCRSAPAWAAGGNGIPHRPPRAIFKRFDVMGRWRAERWDAAGRRYP
jgi:aspartate aminotransferase-like enzyme